MTKRKKINYKKDRKGKKKAQPQPRTDAPNKGQKAKLEDIRATKRALMSKKRRAKGTKL